MNDAAAALQNRRLSIIDFSSEDDSLILPISTLSENEEHEDILYTPNSKKFEDATTKLEQWEREPNSNERITPQRENPKKNTKCNLRKSLAWDSAFFTSAGFLDAKELSSIIEGAEKDEKHETEDDVYKSCESISTLGSDSLTLDGSVEGDLFEDIRASIQKSSKKSNLASEHSKVTSGIARLQMDDSSKKVGMAPRNKMKAPASKYPAPRTEVQGLGKMTKRNLIFPQLPQVVASRRESSISRQSKVAGKSSSSPSPSSVISAKRVPIVDKHDKNEKDKAKRMIGDRASSMSKASVTGGSRGNVPKPTLPSRSSSGLSVSAKNKSTTFTPSANNLPVGNSPFNAIKRKVGAGTLKPPSSISAVRTPSRIASSNKIETGNPSLSHLMSVNKLSSSISPASSVSDWSSESSSSTFMAKHMCNSSRTSIDSCSSRKVLSDTEADQGTNSQIPQSNSSLEGQETNVFISQTTSNAHGGTVLPPALEKPSGLRLPSPKIGFFDGVKSSVRTPRGGTQPHPDVPRVLPKHRAAGPSEGQNKAKLQKLESASSVVSIQNTIFNNQQINDLHPLDSVNNHETGHYNSQVDCLSKQIGLIDINFEIGEKSNADSLSFSQSDISFQDKSYDLVLSSHKELLKSSSTPCPSISPTSFDMAASIRTPFAVRDSFCNTYDNVFPEPTVSEVKPVNLTVPDIIMKENN
ncbi:hypothetical protein Lalb_Chr20g0112961 [Lupinus albus]|uniref:Uncharacterized protein n=1 Tax=Lupinus albus TaxID=3870 RepID=A0A6A4NB00_LUPAL|nr:hypothetical protein Lalb_Chr20g0112961 [Lupinus albus]